MASYELSSSTARPWRPTPRSAAGRRTGLLVTEGFRDTLEIAPATRADRFDLTASRRRRSCRATAPAGRRADRPGRQRRRRARRGRRRAAAGGGSRADGVEAVAICFLYSFRNPEHEQRVAADLRERLPDLRSPSASTCRREIHEYQRASTTSLIAYSAAVQPLVARSDASAARGRRVRRLPLFIMQSSAASCRPPRPPTSRRIAASGPGRRRPRRADQPGGSPGSATDHLRHGRHELRHLPRPRRPRPAMMTSGGSTGRPLRCRSSTSTRSAPAAARSPGSRARAAARRPAAAPAPCPARPATAAAAPCRPSPTPTLVLGRLEPERPLGGEMRLDAEAATDGHPAARRRAARASASRRPPSASWTRRRARWRAACASSRVNRGHDPRGFTLVPSAAPGPMHAAAIAAELGVALLGGPARVVDTSVPPGCSCATSSTTTSARSSVSWPTSGPRSSPRSSRVSRTPGVPRCTARASPTRPSPSRPRWTCATSGSGTSCRSRWTGSRAAPRRSATWRTGSTPSTTGRSGTRRRPRRSSASPCASAPSGRRRRSTSATSTRWPRGASHRAGAGQRRRRAAARWSTPRLRRTRPTAGLRGRRTGDRRARDDDDRAARGLQPRGRPARAFLLCAGERGRTLAAQLAPEAVT